MKSHEIFGHIIRTFGVHAVADNFNVGKELAYKYGQKHGEGLSGAINPLDKMRSLIDYLNESGRGDIASNIQTYLFPQQDRLQVERDTIALRLSAKSSKCFLVVLKALDDGKVDPQEREEILSNAHKLREILSEVEAMCKSEVK